MKTVSKVNGDEQRSIRPYHEDNEAEVAGVWLHSGTAGYTFLPTWSALAVEHAYWVFHHVIQARCVIWVGTVDERIVAYLAMNGLYIKISC